MHAYGLPTSNLKHDPLGQDGMQIFSRTNIALQAFPTLGGHVISTPASRGRDPLEDFPAPPVCMYYTPLTAAQPV